MIPAPKGDCRHLVLVGMRCTGKSTVGSLVASQLTLPFRDADLILETQTGASIRDIFASRGEATFRDLEAQVLRDLIAAEPCVLATGGGVVLRETNRRLLQGAGLVVWLTADADTLAARMQRDPNTADRRPALAGGGMKEIEDILTQRDPLYREVANLVVSTVDRSPDEIAATIVTAWTS